MAESDDNTARLWDAVTGAALEMLESHSSLVRSVAFLPDSKAEPGLIVSNNWVIEGKEIIILLPVAKVRVSRCESSLTF
jgi:WD40 repeat protein